MGMRERIENMTFEELLKRLPSDAAELLTAAPSVVMPGSIREIVDLSLGGADKDEFDVAYDLPDGRRVVEVKVARVRNGISANYIEPYMRRRDPDSMVIADNRPTDKKRFHDRFGRDFTEIRTETFAWMKTQRLAVLLFEAGRSTMGVDMIAIAPENAGFFVFGLALLQGALPLDKLPEDFKPRSVIYVAPPFRHTHFQGKQIVVHNRTEESHELFSYNLYPGPSAKKGVYGVLLTMGELEGWITAHCSTVQVETPYDNIITIMHEGASGGGKSEMLQYVHREADGRLLLGRNLVTGEKRFLAIPRACDLKPVTDDMALCHPALQKGDGRLVVTDAEDAWFVRVDHIDRYGTDIFLEQLSACPTEPLLFLNIDAVPRSRAMIWEHIEDEPGKPCPNPRVILPRSIVPGIVNEPVAIDIRSMGVRVPPCTRGTPSYGIIGLFHLLPPALAWLWRLVAPRGHANPSIVESAGMASEGVGSYWPFATGRRVDQANLLLKQFVETPKTRYILTPNQHIGAWETGFMPQWVMREYLARRGNARFKPEQIRPARCPLLGHAIFTMQVEGTTIPRWFLEVNSQPEVGNEGYDAGAKILFDFFRTQLLKFTEKDLDPLGKKIIDCCLAQGKVDDYADFIPQE
jgi:hypothetical protein